MDCGCNGKAYGAATEPAFYSMPVLSKGLVHPLVADFRKRLASTFPEGKLRNITSPLFDSDLESAVGAYQLASGIPQTGRTDIVTWSALLGVSPDQIEVFTPEPVKTTTPSSGTSPLLWVAAAAAAWFALS